jgi:hypothetical protein
MGKARPWVRKVGIDLRLMWSRFMDNLWIGSIPLDGGMMKVAGTIFLFIYLTCGPVRGVLLKVKCTEQLCS